MQRTLLYAVCHFLALLVIKGTQQSSSDIPQWFYNSVAICYNYYADGDSGQCNSGHSWTGETCAMANAYTAEYRDDTDGRSEGCQMQWRLTAPYNTDTVALAVARLCFKYRADGDVGQCGDHSRQKVTCVPINEYTPFYRDDTDRRAGGCQMSWMIQVPPGVPIPEWMNRVRLCYN